MIITGRLGRDCRVNQHNGQPVVDFSVAVDGGYGDKKTTDWVECSFWGQRAQKVAGYLVKGKPVCVTGEWKTDEYQKKDGGVGFKIGLRVADLTLLGGSTDQQSGPRPAEAPKPSKTFEDDPFNDDIAF